MTTLDAEKVADGIIQAYIGPDHIVTDMGGLFGALVQALLAAHQEGWKTALPLRLVDISGDKKTGGRQRPTPTSPTC